MRLFANDFYRSLLLGFAIGTLGMGASIVAKAHVAEAATPAPVASAQAR